MILIIMLHLFFLIKQRMSNTPCFSVNSRHYTVQYIYLVSREYTEMETILLH